ncbi:hypothetical protein ACGFMK_39900 [Amycolatopsis sp. NPDC049252]|uniref:hypothetical protein n=1 Tax=Amycolatopsis sp. NPDC049252 TaxID=3363933 RepID=UPI00371B29BC
MDFTKIIVAAFESGAIGHAVLLFVGVLVFRVVRQALDPAVIRELSRRRVVKQIQKSARGRFTPAQLTALLALLATERSDPRREEPPSGEP